MNLKTDPRPAEATASTEYETIPPPREIRRPASGVKVSLLESWAGPELPEERIPTPGGFVDFEELFGVHVWVYVCVNRISDSAAGVPFRLTRGEKPVGTADPLFRLLRRPNPYMTFSGLVESVFSCLELTGNCFLEKVRPGPDAGSSELYPLRSDRVSILPGKTEKVAAYKVRTDGRVQVLEPWRVDHVLYCNPFNDYYGLSPLQAGINSVLQDLNSQAFARKFFENDATPGGILQTDQNLSETQYRRLLKQFEERHRGIANRFKIAVLEGGLKYERVTVTQQEMQFIEQRKISRDEILAIYGVPPILAGLETMNFATAYEQKKTFWQETMLPKLLKVQDAFNAGFVRDFGEDYLFEFDVKRIEALSENKEIQSRRHNLYLRMGVMTANEIRKELGLSPVNQAEADLLWFPQNRAPGPTEPGRQNEPGLEEENPVPAGAKRTL